MDQQPLSYVEKLENLHVLFETRQMLKNQLENREQAYSEIEEDLIKIEEEIKQYTDVTDQHFPDTLFNPAFLSFPNDD
ncbi:hypothetical protein [Halalkalibacter urbisdiaboli]|uniref:hypothetical protein n=1 Tax=Halalkalibacter urbisdiaboli TaxID=1960589 RepID=UPI000B4450EB|nr:hypothetical protein [Halalkalibacter urbisdiaboli]